MRPIQILPALFLSLAVVLIPAGFAQDRPATEAPAVAEASPEVKKLAKGLIEDALQVTHAAEIFGDMRRTLRDVYIPTLRDAIEGNLPGIPAPDAKSAASMAKILTVMDYARKAGDELDVALSENRDAMISDAAEQIARSAKPVEIKDIQALFQLPAVHKGLDALYAMTRLLTGFSYEDTQTFSGFSAWANRLDLNMQQGLSGIQGGAVPSKRKIAKAQAFVDDFVSISHLDEMAADVRRFVRDVYAETAPMSEQDRQELREEAEQFEFTYNLQKAIVLAAAPSAIAAALSDDQLARLHGYLRSPSFVKAFDLLRNVVKSATTFTKEDIFEAQESFQDMEKEAKANKRSQDDQEKAKAEWDALVTGWTERLKSRISPETRQGLEKSLEDLDTQDSPI
jgi:hypothetical protein